MSTEVEKHEPGPVNAAGSPVKRAGPMPGDADGWPLDETIAKQTAALLARELGPIGPVLLSRAVASTKGRRELVAHLRERLPEAQSGAILKELEPLILAGPLDDSARPAAQVIPASIASARLEPGDPVRDAGSPAGRLINLQQVRESRREAATGFDLKVLAEIEKLLLPLMGPLAPTLLRKAAAEATSVDDLLDRLAQGIPGVAEAGEFRQRVALVASPAPVRPQLPQVPPSRSRLALIGVGALVLAAIGLAVAVGGRKPEVTDATTFRPVNQAGQPMIQRGAK